MEHEIMIAIIMPVVCLGIPTLLLTVFVVLPAIDIDNQCMSMFPPENSLQTYNSYEHCKHYPKSYNITGFDILKGYFEVKE